MTTPTLKIAAGVAGGYVLGRRRKMRLAIGLGAYLLGKKITTNPTELLATAAKSLQGSPEFAELAEAVRGELSTAGRKAATGALTQGLDGFAEKLADRTDALEGKAEPQQEADEDDEERGETDDADRPRDDYDDDVDEADDERGDVVDVRDRGSDSDDDYDDEPLDEVDEADDRDEEPDEDVEERPRSRSRRREPAHSS